MKVVIMAGGRGVRIQSIAADIPKPMIEIEKRPILEHEIISLRNQGFKDILITVSYMSETIMNYFGDGEKFGVSIEYFQEDVPLGNAGALIKLKSSIGDKPFLLLNADSIFDIDFKKMISFHEKTKAMVTILTHPNDHPYDSGLILADSNKSVFRWLAKEDIRPKYYKNRVNAGIHIIDPKLFESINIDSNSIGKYDDVTNKIVKVDLDRQLLKPLAGTGKMFCYDSTEYVKDMGTPERLLQVKSDFNQGIIKSRNLRYKQKAIFLDRDGTINKYIKFLNKIEDFELIEHVASSIRKINKLGYLCIVITNQPVIARGELSFECLEEIHNKMETLLGFEGAYIDAIYYCPHHPDSGYDGEIQELKIKCDCRKPGAGMFYKASKELNIDLEQSWMVGDSEVDIKAGIKAGCRTILIHGEGTSKVKGNYGQLETLSSVDEFVEKYL